MKKLLLKQDLPFLQDYDNRFSQKVQNVPQKLRFNSIRCEQQSPSLLDITASNSRQTYQHS